MVEDGEDNEDEAMEDEEGEEEEKAAFEAEGGIDFCVESDDDDKDTVHKKPSKRLQTEDKKDKKEDADKRTPVKPQQIASKTSPLDVVKVKRVLSIGDPALLKHMFFNFFTNYY